MSDNQENLKFRAWIERLKPEHNFQDIIEGHMSEPFTFTDFDGDYFIPEGCYIEDMEIVRYTGRTDINGENIYEGHILETNTNVHGKEAKHIAEVIYSDLDCSFEVLIKPNNDQEHLQSFVSFLEWSNPVVIGNIYEDKELLKEDKDE